MTENVNDWPPVNEHGYDNLRPILEHVRIMNRFLTDVIDPDPELKPLYDRLLAGYLELLQPVLAPYAVELAEMLIALEDAYTKGDNDVLERERAKQS
jgi:hypothetical protein